MQTKLACDPEELRREIAEVIANEVNSYGVPSICVRFSIQKTVAKKAQRPTAVGCLSQSME